MVAVAAAVAASSSLSSLHNNNNIIMPFPARYETLPAAAMHSEI